MPIETRRHIALKPYLEMIRGCCEGLSSSALTHLVVGLATEVPVAERGPFLARIEKLVGMPSGQQTHAENVLPRILGDIEALREEIAARRAAIEDGSYWEDLTERGEWYDDDDYPDALGDDNVAALEALFDGAGAFFVSSDYAAARRIYAELFGLLDECDPDGSMFVSSGSNGDILEARARYCRCVYETTDAERRAEEMAHVLEVDRQPGSTFSSDESSRLPVMQDVIDAQAAVMEGMEPFLRAWRALLSSRTTNRAHVLLLEVTYWLEGTEGLARLARAWQSTQPRGYVYWLQKLADEQAWDRVLSVGQEGLSALAPSEFRVQVADALAAAAARQDRDDIALLARRERFLSSGRELDLVNLLQLAERRGQGESELESAVDFLQSHKESMLGAAELHVKALLMSGRLQTAWEEIRHEPGIGWSHGSTGIVFGSILYVLTEGDERAATIGRVLRRYAGVPFAEEYWFDSDPEDTGDQSCGSLPEVMAGLAQVSLSREEAVRLMTWARKIALKRIHHIVSNKHRRAYDRAAEVLGALAECCILRGQKCEATELMREICRVHYNRHTAFRSGVRGVIDASSLLKESSIDV